MRIKSTDTLNNCVVLCTVNLFTSTLQFWRAFEDMKGEITIIDLNVPWPISFEFGDGTFLMVMEELIIQVCCLQLLCTRPQFLAHYRSLNWMCGPQQECKIHIYTLGPPDFFLKSYGCILCKSWCFYFFRFFTEVYIKPNVYIVLSSDVVQFPYTCITKHDKKNGTGTYWRQIGQDLLVTDLLATDFPTYLIGDSLTRRIGDTQIESKQEKGSIDTLLVKCLTKEKRGENIGIE